MNSGTPLPRGTSACSDPLVTRVPGRAQGNNAKTDPACITSPRLHRRERLGFQRQPSPRPHDGEVRRRPAVSDRPLRDGAHVEGRSEPRRRACHPARGRTWARRAASTPLFASQLPDGSSTDPSALCNLTPGSRTKDLVFYAHIGGVPSSLLQFPTPGDAKASTLTVADWVKILGNDPLHYDYSGIDPHMVESCRSAKRRSGAIGTRRTHQRLRLDHRPGRGARDAGRPRVRVHLPPRGASRLHPARERERPRLPIRDVEGPPRARPAPADLQPIDADTADRSQGLPDGPRVLLLAKKLGPQGVVSSICPDSRRRQRNERRSALDGYRPAVAAIIDRLRDTLSADCLPGSFQVDAGGVDCLILMQIPNGAAGTTGTCTNPVCPAAAGLAVPLGRTTCSRASARTSRTSTTSRSGRTQRTAASPTRPAYRCASSSSSRSRSSRTTSPAARVQPRPTTRAGATSPARPQRAARRDDAALPEGASASLQCIEQGATVGQ